MRNHHRALVLAISAGSLVFASAWAAEMFARAPRTLEVTPAFTSRVAADGDTAAWLEIPTGRNLPVLAVRSLSGGLANRVTVPGTRGIDPTNAFAWLLDGPDVSVGCHGACVRVAFVARWAMDNSDTIHVYNHTSGAWSGWARETGPIRGAALDGDDLFVSRTSSDNADLFRLPIEGGTIEPFAGGPGQQIMPAASSSWVVWLDQPDVAPGPGTEPAQARLMARPRAGGQTIEVTREAWLVDPVVNGDRVLWIGPYSQGAALHVFDLPSGTDGILASDPRPCPRCGVADYLRGDLSVELIAHAGRDQMLHVYDARALTSVGNLGSYFTEFTSVRTTTASAAPAVDEARVLWSEPYNRGAPYGSADEQPGLGAAAQPGLGPAEQPAPGSAARVMLLEADRGRVLLPRVESGR